MRLNERSAVSLVNSSCINPTYFEYLSHTQYSCQTTFPFAFSKPVPVHIPSPLPSLLRLCRWLAKPIICEPLEFKLKLFSAHSLLFRSNVSVLQRIQLAEGNVRCKHLKKYAGIKETELSRVSSWRTHTYYKMKWYAGCWVPEEHTQVINEKEESVVEYLKNISRL